jgi:hypothetical protein
MALRECVGSIRSELGCSENTAFSLTPHLPAKMVQGNEENGELKRNQSLQPKTKVVLKVRRTPQTISHGVQRSAEGSTHSTPCCEGIIHVGKQSLEVGSSMCNKLIL